MARITGFSVTGLAGRTETVAFDLNPTVNVFWGLNGSGKTSLLRILHSALSGDGALLLRVPFEKASVRILLDDGKVVTRSASKSDRERARLEEFEERLSRHGLYRAVADRELALFEESAAPNWSSRPQSASEPVEHGYLPIGRITERSSRVGARRGPRREIQDEASYDQAFADEISALWQRYSLRASTQIQAAQEEGLAAVLGVVLNGPGGDPERFDVGLSEGYELVRAFMHGQRIQSIPERHKFGERFETDPVLRALVAKIAEMTQRVNDALLPQKLLQRLVSEMMSGDKSISVAGRRLLVQVGNREIPVTGLSSGEKQLLLILLETMAAESSAVIIDEPELSMHVDWQYRLVDTMRTVNPLGQIIVATHSPEVMANISDAEVFEL